MEKMILADKTELSRNQAGETEANVVVVLTTDYHGLKQCSI